MKKKQKPSRTNIRDVFAEKLSLEDAREILVDVVEDSTRTAARQIYEGHRQILRVLAKLERHLTANYGVKPKQGKAGAK